MRNTCYIVPSVERSHDNMTAGPTGLPAAANDVGNRRTRMISLGAWVQASGVSSECSPAATLVVYGG
ncbi:unnamed protein product [Calypogeia fissa]